MENFADLYSDYLISSSSYATSTGMANLLSIKHDKITRELSNGDYDSKFLWKQSKVYVKELTQSKELITLSFDDSIEEKRYTDESELHCWHFDHTFGKSVRGVNFLTALIEVGTMRLPCAVEFVKKDLWKKDPKTGKEKRTFRAPDENDWTLVKKRTEYSIENSGKTVGEYIYDALLKNNIEVYKFDYKVDSLINLISNNYSAAILMLHGKDGEDGVIQGFLECFNIPYSGSGILASSLAMDKYRTKLLWNGLSIPNARFLYIDNNMHFVENPTKIFNALIQNNLTYPLIVKPNHGGSTLGISIVNNDSELIEAINKSLGNDDAILIEELDRKSVV